MATYKYKAKDEEGRITSCEMMAADENELHEKLKLEKLLLMDAREKVET